MRPAFNTLFSLILFLLGTLSVHASPSNEKPELLVYTYDTMVAPGGLGSVIFPIFEKKLGCRIRALGLGDGGQILTRLQLDAQRGKMGAQIILGIDQNIWERIHSWIEPWNDWKPKGYEKLNKMIKVGPGFLPYDYGFFSLIVRTEALNGTLNLQSAIQFTDLNKEEFTKNIILEDPRTSTPGLAFLLFSHKVLGESVWTFWKQFKRQWLTLTPGWGQAYGLFLKGEAPIVWSYVTSQAYHEEHGDKGKYRAVLFKEGQPYQVEGAALVRGGLQTPEQKRLAKEFLEFLISPEVQAQIPKTNWMMPALEKVKLPKSFTNLPQVSKWVVETSPAAETDRLLKEWEKAIY